MSISEKKQKWTETAVAKTLARSKERYADFRTTSGIEIERCFTPEEYAGYEEKLGLPGEYPFTRGVQPTMYRGQFWTMRQYAGFGNAAESNERYKYLLGAGQTGLSIAFDLPTQMGYDSDAAMSQGEVGKVGVAIDSLADMEILFDGIPLDKVSTSMTCNSTAAILLCMYIAVAEKQGVSPAQVSGTIQNDILKEYMARGTYIYPPKESMRIITDIFAYCKDNVPKWNTISISGYHIREAGSSAVQEVAFTIADGIAYVEAAIKAGMNVDEFAPRLAFFFNAHNNVLEEVAKFRAARRIWAKVMKERFGAKDVKSQSLRFHTQTAGCTLTAQQPDNNIMRVTLQALAACLGGTQSLHTNSRDEALALPTEDSVRIALRTQQVIAYESGCADSVDPLGGSFYIESMTDQIEAAALAYIAKIDELGGAVEAISRGFQQKEIQDSAYAYQKAIEKGELVIVGVNKFTVSEPPPTGLLRVKEEVEIAQKKSLAAVKAGRNNEAVKASLAALEVAAKGTGNLMPVILEAVKVYATLGEIADVFRGVFGKHQETVVL
jgi:methylmalonyl-CoA mutase N-terminal domain/subunit